MKPTLPQFETPAGLQARASVISTNKKNYSFDYDFLPKFALSKGVPTRENFTSKYIGERLKASTSIATNLLATKARAPFDPLDDLGDYDDFFQLIKLPAVAKVYKTDEAFAEQRLSGANPLIIQLLKKGDARAGVLSKVKALEFDLTKELDAGNIFVCDYTGTDPTYRGPAKVKVGGVAPKGKKYLPKPLAFFRWNGSELLPVAIQIDASTNPDVYTPSDGRIYTKADKELDWLFAKTCVQIADSNHHELSTHLSRCHLTFEPLAVSTCRNLADHHPISYLLRPHLRFHVSNDELAHTTLLARDGVLDSLLAGEFSESMAVVTEAYDTWDIMKFAFPNDIKTRGVDKIPHYPYREDGMLLWSATRKFASAYIKNYYPDAATLLADTELQAWAAELAEPVLGGRVKGFPSKIDNVETLIDIATTTMFTCGPMHSAVNFTQADYIAHSANMPFAAYVDPVLLSRSSSPVDMATFLAMLPPNEKAAEQLNTMQFLSAYRYDTYGDYRGSSTFKDYYGKHVDEIFVGEHEKVLAMMDQFKKDLEAAELEIEARNVNRKVKYDVLRPSLILNSISI